METKMKSTTMNGKHGICNPCHTQHAKDKEQNLLTTLYTPSFLNRKGSARTTGELMRYKRNASCTKETIIREYLTKQDMNFTSEMAKGSNKACRYSRCSLLNGI